MTFSEIGDTKFVLQIDFRVGRFGKHVMYVSGAEGRAGESLVSSPTRELVLAFDQQNTSKPRILTLVWLPAGVE